MKQNPEVKYRVNQILDVVKKIAPGKLVELRIPPYAAIQCMSGGIHRRGIPPNVVEMDGETLIELANCPAKWEILCAQGMISASGTASNLSELFNEIGKLLESFSGGADGK